MAVASASVEEEGVWHVTCKQACMNDIYQRAMTAAAKHHDVTRSSEASSQRKASCEDFCASRPQRISKRQSQLNGSLHSAKWLLIADQEPLLGSHIVTPRRGYLHHGIYVGGGFVIHYAGLTNRRWRGPVEEVSLVHFANGHPVRVRHDQRLFTCAEVVKRARSRLGERRYRIFTNNCEHFCAWVLREDCRSTQVEQLRRLPRNLYRALLGALAVTRPTIKVPTGRPLVLSTGERSAETESLAGN